jgi:thymidylate kinase
LCVDNPQIPPITKRALYRADSFYNWEKVVEPNVANSIILSDRNWVSDLAYGTVLTDCDMEQLLDFNLALVPEMQALTNVIYLELPKEVRENRLSKNMADAMDTLGEEVRDKIASAYEEVLRDWIPSGQVHRVSTLEPEELVTQKIVDIILSQ